MERCKIPPKGWICTRAVGHDGPCASLRRAPWWSRVLCELGFHSWRNGPGCPCTVCGKEDELWNNH